MSDFMEDSLSRRDFIGAGAAAASAAGLLPVSLPAPRPSAVDRMIGVPFEARSVVRVGLIGVGGRGRSLLRDLLAIDEVRITALCDLVPEHAAKGASMVQEAGQRAAPALFDGSDDAWERLVARDDL